MPASAATFAAADNSRRFGVEIEFKTSHRNGYEVAEAMRQTGLNVEFMGYTHRRTAAWKLVTDASVAGGFELVSPPLMFGDWDAIRAAERALAAVGARVDKDCGLHVHHDAAGFSPRAIANVVGSYGLHQDYISSAMPASRRNSRWAKPLKSLAETFLRGDFSSVNSVRRVLNADRYHAINLESLPRHGTIEFRQHGGTTKAIKIIRWVELTRAIIDRCAVDRKLTFRSDAASRSERWVRETAGKEVAAYIRNRREALA